MPTSLSLDLRVRVLAAVTQGLSHRAAGERFGVSAASVSRWRALERERGEARALPTGGDRKSGRIEALAKVSASVPLAAAKTWWPSPTRKVCSSCRMSGSSSMTRMLPETREDTALGSAVTGAGLGPSAVCAIGMSTENTEPRPGQERTRT